MASRTISTKLAIEGEDSYKRAIADINNSNKTMRSELALLESKYHDSANSMAALQAKGDALGKAQELQAQKVKTMQAALENAKTAQQNYNTQVTAAKEKVTAAEKELERLKNTEGSSRQAQDALTKEIAKYKEELQKSEQYQRAAERGVSDWQRQLNYAQRDLNQLDAEISQNDKYLDEARRSADGCASSIDRYGREVRDAGDDSDDFGRQSSEAVNTLASALAAAGVAATIKEIAQALNECVENAKKFESDMAEVFTLLPDSAAEAREKMSADMLQFSTDMNVLTEDAVPALYQAISAGVPSENVFTFMEVAQKAAVGGVTGLETAVDGLTSIVNAYGEANISAQETADMLFTAVKLGKTDFSQLSGSIYNVVPIAASSGVKLNDIAAALAAITAKGTPTSVATTQLRQVLAELTKEGSQVDKTFKEIAGEGFTQFIAGGNNLQDALQLLEKKASDSNVSISNMFSSVEAGQAALSLTGGGTQKFTEALAAMEASAGAVDTAYETMAGTAEYQSQRVEVALENVKTAIGNSLKPAFAELSMVAADGLQWANEFIEKNPWLVKALTAVTVAVGVLAVGVTGYTLAVNVAKAATKAFAAVTAVSVGHIMLVVSAIAGLITALTLAAASMGDTTSKSRELTESIKASREAHEEAVAGIEKERESTLTMVAALEAAISQENKTAAEKATILRLVDQLNEAMPELSLAYDEQTDSLNMTTEALHNLVQAEAERQLQAEAVDRMVQVEKDTILLKQQQTEAEERLKEAKENLAAAGEEAYKVDKRGASAAQELQGKVTILQGEYDSLTEQMAENEAEAAELNQQYGDLSKSIEANTKAANENNGAAGRQTLSWEELAQKAEELTGITDTLTSAQDTLTSALAEQQKTGSLNLDTALELIEAGYTSALTIDTETGAITLNKDAYIALAQAKIEEQIQALETQRQSVISKAMMVDEGKAAMDAAMGYANKAKMEQLAIRSAKGQVDSVSGQLAAYDAQIAALAASKNALGSYSGAVASTARSSSKASAKVKTQAEKDLETFKELQATLKHEYAMGEKTADQYYAELAQLQQTYLSDPANLEQSRKIDEEIQGYNKGLTEYKRLREQLDHERAMGLKTEAEYYAELEQLRDTYLSDEANQSEYQKVSEELHGYNQKLEEYKRLRSRLDHERQVGLKSEAEYYDELVQLRNEYLTDDDAQEERYKADEELFQLYADQLDETLKTYEGQVNAVAETYKEKLGEVQEAMEELQRQQGAMVSKLGDYGDLFEIDKDGKMKLNDLQDQIDTLDKYDETLTKLKENGISDGLLNEVVGMGVDEAITYGEQLLKMAGKDDEAWKEYNEKYDEKQKRAIEVAEEFYKEQMDSITQQYEDIKTELGKELDDMTLDAFEAGKDTMGELAKGIKAKQDEAVQAAIAAVQAVKDQFNIEGLPSINVDGSHAGGLSYVPYDGYLAELHKGERVLTAAEAKQFIAMSMPKRFDVPQVQSIRPEQIESAVSAAMQKTGAVGQNSAPIHVEAVFELDGKVMARKNITYNREAERERGASFVRGG